MSDEGRDRRPGGAAARRLARPAGGRGQARDAQRAVFPELGGAAAESEPSWIVRDSGAQVAQVAFGEAGPEMRSTASADQTGESSAINPSPSDSGASYADQTSGVHLSARPPAVAPGHEDDSLAQALARAEAEAEALRAELASERGKRGLYEEKLRAITAAFMERSREAEAELEAATFELSGMLCRVLLPELVQDDVAHLESLARQALETFSSGEGVVLRAGSASYAAIKDLFASGALEVNGEPVALELDPTLAGTGFVAEGPSYRIDARVEERLRAALRTLRAEGQQDAFARSHSVAPPMNVPEDAGGSAPAYELDPEASAGRPGSQPLSLAPPRLPSAIPPAYRSEPPPAAESDDAALVESQEES